MLLTLSLIAAEAVDCVLAAMIGATLTLGLLAFLGLAPTFDKIVTYVDTSAVGLLFGTILLVGLLSTSRFFFGLKLQRCGCLTCPKDRKIVS